MSYMHVRVIAYLTYNIQQTEEKNLNIFPQHIFYGLQEVKSLKRSTSMAMLANYSGTGKTADGGVVNLFLMD